MSTTHKHNFGEPWNLQDFPHPIHKNKGCYWLNPAQFNRAVFCVNALAGISDPVAAIQQLREKLSIIAGAHPTARRANYAECMELAEQALALLTPNK